MIIFKFPIYKQLLFKKQDGGYYNYVLNPCFKNREKQTAYNWFHQHILGANHFDFSEDDVDDIFFTLQTFPYSSTDAGFSRKSRLRQHWYNRELIDWGICHKKVFVITRAVEYWLELMNPEIVEKEPDRFFTTTSSRKIDISSNNLIMLKDADLPKKQKPKAKEDAAKKLQEYIDSVLLTAHNSKKE